MVSQIENSIEEGEHALVQLEEELKNAENSIALLNTKLEQQIQRKTDCLNKMQDLQEEIRGENANTVVKRLLPLLLSLKALEREASDFQSHCNAKHSRLQAEVNELENRILYSKDDRNLFNDIDYSLHNSLEKLNSVRRELALKLREILSLKRQLDDVPSQAELIQYDHRFSELNVHIQEKHRHTSKLYATFNALLEIRDLMLKETSLLNSISSQFKDAITSPAGRLKLIDSMEGILRGTQQKLEKVQLALQVEQNACDAVKERYTAAVADQRSCYSLLKAFQEECTKNERLKSLSSKIDA